MKILYKIRTHAENLYVLVKIQIIIFSFLSTVNAQQACELDGLPANSKKISVSLKKLKNIANLAACKNTITKGYSDLKGGKLSPLWAQEFTGVDLSKEFVRNARSSMKIFVGVSDVDFDKDSINNFINETTSFSFSGQNGGDKVGNPHGEPVTHLIFNPHFGSSGNGILRAVTVGVSNSEDAKGLKTSEEKVHAALSHMIGKPIRVLNVSMRAGNEIESKQVIDTLINEKKVLVFASGNEHPKYPLEKNQQRSDIINVGNLSFSGFLSSRSREGQFVDILAPSGTEVLTQQNNGVRTFGGTSGAAPQVTGVIADMLSVNPGLNRKQVEEILKQTAIPTFIQNAGSTKNGAGYLNAYKAVRAAYKLSKKMHQPFNFSDESTQLAKEAKEHIAEGDCDSFRVGFDKLRKAFFLQPNDELGAEIAAIYSALGYEYNAKFLSSLSSDEHKMDKYFDYMLHSKPLSVVNGVFISDPAEGLDAIVLAHRLPKNNKYVLRVNTFVENLLKSKNEEKILQGLELLSYFPYENSNKFIPFFSYDSKSIQKKALESIYSLGKKEGYEKPFNSIVIKSVQHKDMANLVESLRKDGSYQKTWLLDEVSSIIRGERGLIN